MKWDGNRESDNVEDHWFNTGLQNGGVKSCDTFSTRSL